MPRRLVSGVLALTLITSAAAADVADLLHQARRERDAGELDVALFTLGRAHAIAPQSADVLLLLGQTQSFVGEHDQALVSLGRACLLAPDYLDVHLAIVRAWMHRGEHTAAERALEAALRLAPTEPRVALLGALLAFARDDLQLAQARFERARELDPDASEPLAGLGDVAMAENDPFAAESLYARALEGSPGDANLYDRLLHARERAKRWRIEAEIGFSRFDDDRSPWRETASRLSYRLDARSALTSIFEVGERFRRRDIYFELAFAHRWSSALSGYVAAGATPEADYREAFALRGGGAVRLQDGGGALGPSVLTLDARFADYDRGATLTLTPGLAQYLLDGRLTLTGRWINVLEADGRHLDGPLVRLDARPDDRVGLHVGLAAAPESEGRLVVDTRSLFGGIALGIDEDTVVRAGFAQESREHGATRTALTLGAAVEF